MSAFHIRPAKPDDVVRAEHDAPHCAKYSHYDLYHQQAILDLIIDLVGILYLFLDLELIK